MTLNIEVEPAVKNLFPELSLGYVSAGIHITPACEALKTAVLQTCESLHQTLSPPVIKSMTAVEATRKAYSKLGKDPSRYRPSAESLLRRVGSGRQLYPVNNAVDILNMVSIQTGFSICGFDADVIEGNIRFGTGRSGEPYEGIGRGELNIENLPVFRDSRGAFGTPTSDSTRTMITETTRRILMIFPSFFLLSNLEKALELSVHYLQKYAGAQNIKYGISL